MHQFKIIMQAPQKRYNSYSSFLQNNFQERVQKISLDTGFTCPNRDGSKGVGGCTYCNNNSFNPDYCEPEKSIHQQLEEGVAFFSSKYKAQQYLAYFQAYTNTYADLSLLRKMYFEAVSYPGVIGLVIGTRPDCINEEIVSILEDIAKTHYVSLEFGVESTINRTLEIVNRCHTFEETKAAYELAQNRGIHLGAHMILGLPGESKEEMLNHAVELNKLPINSLKLHQLQIIKNTLMAFQYKNKPEMFNLFGLEEYLDFISDFVGLLRPDIVIERFSSQSPVDLLIAPYWGGLKNFELVSKVEKRLVEKDSWQGKYYKPQ